METVNEAALKIEENDKTLYLTFNRAEAKNSLNSSTITEFHQALDRAQLNHALRCVVIRGNTNHFCTGMDFQEAAQENDKTFAERQAWNTQYMKLLERLSTIPKATIACVEGVVMAGGMGIVSACDLVLASEQARFSLSEALWGLLPSMVIPYLIRRTGFQTAYRLTMTAESVTAVDAQKVQLVDSVTDNMERSLKQYQTRFYRLATETIGDLKHYMNQQHPITAETQQRAINETARLSGEPRVQQNIANFIHHQRFPWEIYS